MMRLSNSWWKREPSWRASCRHYRMSFPTRAVLRKEWLPDIFNRSIGTQTICVANNNRYTVLGSHQVSMQFDFLDPVTQRAVSSISIVVWVAWRYPVPSLVRAIVFAIKYNIIFVNVVDNDRLRMMITALMMRYVSNLKGPGLPKVR